MAVTSRPARERPLIAFFDYPDVFEDFYPKYGIDQQQFATRFTAAGNHAFLTLLQREVGDVIWYSFSLKPELDEARHEVVGCRVRILPSSWLHRRMWNAFYMPTASWRWRRFYPAYATAASYVSLVSWPFLSALRKDRPDFFFVQDYATGRFDVLLAIARALGVPLVAYHTGSSPDIYLGRFAKHWSIRRAECLIASGRHELDRLENDFGVPPSRVKVILTPIDIVMYRPIDRSAACTTAALDPERRYVVYVGRLDDRIKRVSALIRAFTKASVTHADVDLVIVGDGPDKKELQAQAETTAPGRVRFLGWIADACRLSALYNAAECLALPSWSEGFPTVVGEAMACGTPVLASRVGGVSELVVADRTGWLCEPGDDDALTSRLAFILAHPGQVRAMRPAARQIAEERVSPDRVSAELKACFSWARPAQRRREIAETI
jgi:glycosyltransferase involved in cell wall biosynthesis